MKSRFVLLILILISLIQMNIYSQSGDKVTIAVLEFRVLGRVNSSSNFGKGIQEIIMTNLGQNALIKIVERARLKAIAKELSYSGSDLYNYRNALKLGKLLQAKYLVTGSIVGFGRAIRINARIINVQTGTVYKTFKHNSIGIEKIFSTLENLSVDIESGLLGINAHSNANAPKIEIAFVIDSTGSMHDEIHVVRSKINEILNRTMNATPRPVVSIAVIDYKDTDDEYITRRFKFTSDLNSLRRHLNSINARGGGDYEESVTSALIKAIETLQWSKREASKMIFLIADAPAHKKNKYKFPAIIKSANKKAISIYTIACSGLDKSGVKSFKFLSKNTNAIFSYLSYRQEYVSAKGERTEIITRGKEIYKRSIKKIKSRIGSPASAVDKLKKPAWAKSAADRKLAPEYKRGRITEHSGDDRAEVISSDKIRVKNMRKKGKMENNLDEILIKNIKTKASKDLRIKYGTTNEKYTGAFLALNSGKKVWVFVKSKKNFHEIKTNVLKKIWIFGSVKQTGDGFIISNAMQSKGFVPDFAKKDFISVGKKISYYEQNGITHLKKWYFKVKILKIKKLR